MRFHLYYTSKKLQRLKMTKRSRLKCFVFFTVSKPRPTENIIIKKQGKLYFSIIYRYNLFRIIRSESRTAFLEDHCIPLVRENWINFMDVFKNFKKIV